MHKSLVSILIMSSLVLSACGGGGEGGDHHHHEPENTTRRANGIWHGTISADHSGIYDMTLLILDGVVAGVSYDARRLFSGYLLGADDVLAGELTEFNAPGEPVDDLHLEGFFHPQHSIDLVYHASSGAGGIALDFDPATHAPAGLHIIAGHYQDIDGDIDLLVTAYGEINGSDASGCFYDGFVYPASDGSNLYEWVMNRSGCQESAKILALATHYGGGVVDVFVRDSNEHMQLWEIEDTG